jgi:predicted RNase H-like HicB family nuclease
VVYVGEIPPTRLLSVIKCSLRSHEHFGSRGTISKYMVAIQPIVEVEREEDGRILASVPDLPGVMAYGANEDEAVRNVKSVALQVLADMIESGEERPRSAQSPVLPREHLARY